MRPVLVLPPIALYPALVACFRESHVEGSASSAIVCIFAVAADGNDVYSICVPCSSCAHVAPPSPLMHVVPVCVYVGVQLDEPPAERTPPPAWEEEGVAIPLQAGKRTKEDPDWRPMTRCRHVLATVSVPFVFVFCGVML